MKRTIITIAAILLSAGLYAQAPVYSDSSTALDKYMVPASGETASPDKDGFIGRWMLLEPISKPNPSNIVFTDSYIREVFGQTYFKGQLGDVLPKDGAKVKIDKKTKLRWHAMDSKLFNVKLFRFATNLSPERYGVIFWAATVVNCQEDIPGVRMSVGSNSASMWWINGEEAVILSGDRRMVMDDCASERLTLHKGRNVIWGAVINGPGMSDFCVRFIDEEGKPVTNFTLSTQ